MQSLIRKNTNIIKNSVLTYDYYKKYERGSFSRYLKYIKSNNIKVVCLRNFKFVDDYQKHKLKKVINKQIQQLYMDESKEEVMHMVLLFKNMRVWTK
jgi:serine kinase of HPr protein (carbohydrate metabolism regulator)